MSQWFKKITIGLTISIFTSGIFHASAADHIVPSAGNHPDNQIRVVTGGYEAIAADNEQREISGPRTTAVKNFLHAQGFTFKIDTMLWSRAYNIIHNSNDNILIYPLTRTKEREAHFQWVKKIDEHHFNLLSHVSVNANELTKADIISGKYFAVCETTTSNCHMLLDYGFPDENIFRISGVEVDGIVMRLALGRASFMMENYEIVSNIAKRIKSLEGKIEKVHNVTVVMEDYLAAKSLSPNVHARLTQNVH
ncbi:MAG: hypothetical protein AB3N28_01155 [Kordiimonas sp.]